MEATREDDGQSNDGHSDAEVAMDWQLDEGNISPKVKRRSKVPRS